MYCQNNEMWKDKMYYQLCELLPVITLRILIHSAYVMQFTPHILLPLCFTLSACTWRNNTIMEIPTTAVFLPRY